MDTKLIQQYGEDILCYRLRTARQKKRMQYNDFEKQLIQLHKEERKLYQQIRELGWAPLVPPFQRGWRRSFVLRDDVARSPQATLFQNILDKINTRDWSYRKDFRIRKRKEGKKKYAVKEQKLKMPDQYEFFKMEFTDKEKKFFYEEWKYHGQKRYKRFVFTEPWRFVLRVKPNIIDKIKLMDEILEARLKEIDNYLKRSDFRWAQTKLLDGNCKWRHCNDFEKYKETYLFKDWPLERVLDSLKEEL